MLQALHPEVKGKIGFLMLLFAGTTKDVLNTSTHHCQSQSSGLGQAVKNSYSKKVKTNSKSAGNQKILTIFVGSSETTCSNIITNLITKNHNKISYFKNKSNLIHCKNYTTKLEKISIHKPKMHKPLSDYDFGHYLAGLIDGDGHLGKNVITIAFHINDVSLAYYIKGILGYGTIKKIKDKNAYVLNVTKPDGRLKILNLINGKLRTPNKLNQINNDILPYFKLTLKKEFKLNIDNNLDNFWLSGFSDADASFQIKIVKREERTKEEIRLNYQIDQKHNDLLILIKNYLGGNIGYRVSQDTYYYGSTSFGSAKKVIKYFDKYHLLSSKHINYLKWRKAYILIQNGDHLTLEGIEKIKKIKKSMAYNLDMKYDIMEFNEFKNFIN